MTGRDLAGRLDLREISGRTRLRLRVKPGSKRNALLGLHGGALKIAVIARPDRGKANRSVIKFLAKQLGVAPTEIDLVAGGSSPDKTVLVPLSVASLTERLSTILPSSG